MGGLFGVVSKKDCSKDLFYGTDYHSHLGTRYGGLAVKNSNGLKDKIHNIESAQFRSRFQNDLARLSGNSGIGIISDYEAQPLIVGSHLGKYAIVTVNRINNLDELTKRAYTKGAHFSEMSDGKTNPTEVIASLINEGHSFEEGIQIAQESIKGSCTMLLLTEQGKIYAARDKLGRHPIIIGKKDNTYAATSETCAFPNLKFSIDSYLGPGEIVLINQDGVEQKKEPNILWLSFF
jgi:amidophosphoribosyltransferase